MNWNDLIQKLKQIFRHRESGPKQRDAETEQYFQNYFSDGEDSFYDKPDHDQTDIASFARPQKAEPEMPVLPPSDFWQKADEKAQEDDLSLLPVQSAVPLLDENENKTNTQMEEDEFLEEEKPYFSAEAAHLDVPVYQKQTMLQAFEWYLPDDGKHWKNLSLLAQDFQRLGITAAWLPPAYKGHGGAHDVGYGVYDLYDLGEFRQKGSIRTKYGTKDAYLQAVRALQKQNIKVLADIVIDHRMGADETEMVRVRSVDGGNRNRITSGTYDAKVWSRFTFPGRKNRYSDFSWDASCFNGTDYNALNGRHDIMLFDGKSWNEHVSREFGNYDYVMGLCTDFHIPKVREELFRWGRWYLDQTHVDGFRLDCLKSIDSTFFAPWLQDLQNRKEEKLFTVGEYWSGNIDELQGYLRNVSHSMKLFDIPLHYHLFDCSRSNGNYDVRRLFDNTLTQREPEYAVAFVDNHDTQPMQALCSWVEDWFKTSAYACILLKSCQNPCVFWGDVYGIPKSQNKPVTLLREMLWIRSRILSGNIIDLYDNDAQKACWIALSDHPVLVLFTIGDRKTRKVRFRELENRTFVDVANPQTIVRMNRNGEGEFSCSPGCCSVFILEEDYRRMLEEEASQNSTRKKKKRK